mmetsp:Transcript_25576/g.73867  ORF Transcript_25576/g.73867 Transcript_25576/m.73867 type:complete len:495 (-) Transcript_25576:105-1589(-)
MCLEKLLVNGPASVNVPQPHLEVRVIEEDPLLLALGNGPAEDLPGAVEAELPNLELRVDLPDLRKGELFVGDDPDQIVVDRARLLDVASLELLEEGIVDPQVDVAPPEALLLHRRLERHCPLVDLADPAHVAAALLESAVVEPDVVVPPVFLDTLLVDKPPLVEDDLFDGIAVAVLLLEGHVRAVQLVAGSFRKDVERKLVDRLRTLHLLLPLLELGKPDVELLIKLLAEHFHALFVARASPVHVAVLLLELAEPQEGLLRRAAAHVALHDPPALVDLAAPLLELAVLEPGRVLGLPLHPALVDRPRTCVVPEQLFHVRILVPELVHPRQQLRDAVEEVPRVVHELVLHLHLQVLEPDADVLVLHVQRPLEDGPRAAEFLLGRLPLGVLCPGANVLSLAPDDVLELLPLPDSVHLQLVLVDDALPWRLGLILLAVHGLAQELLRRDLLRVGGLVPDHGLLPHSCGVLRAAAALALALAEALHGARLERNRGSRD